MVPPHASPTSHAFSSDTLNAMSLGVPRSMAARSRARWHSRRSHPKPIRQSFHRRWPASMPRAVVVPSPRRSSRPPGRTDVPSRSDDRGRPTDPARCCSPQPSPTRLAKSVRKSCVSLRACPREIDRRRRRPSRLLRSLRTSRGARFRVQHRRCGVRRPHPPSSPVHCPTIAS